MPARLPDRSADLASAPRRVIDRHLYVPHYLWLLTNALSAGASRIYLKQLAIGLNEGRIAAVLGHVPGLTAAELSQAMAMNKSIVSRSLGQMRARGLIHQTGTPRARANWLTDAGYQLEGRVVSISLAREERLLDGFDHAERSVLLDFLARMQANLPKLGAAHRDDAE